MLVTQVGRSQNKPVWAGVGKPWIVGRLQGLSDASSRGALRGRHCM